MVRMRRIIIISLCFLALTSSASAAPRFWVGGTGNWDAVTTTHWSATSGGGGGVSVPGASDDVTFDAASGGGTVTLTTSPSIISITGGAFTGTLDTNNQNLILSGTFSYTGSGIRGLTLRGSTLSAATWSISTVTNLTFSGASSTVNVSGTSGGFSPGALNYGTTTVTMSVGQTFTMNGSSGASFVNLTFTGGATKAQAWALPGNITIYKNLTFISNTIANRLLMRSDTRGTARTITTTGATVNYTNVDFTDITISGGSVGSNSSVGNCAGNTGITFTSATTTYWIGNTGNWSATTSWSSSSGGSSGLTLPLCQDNVIFDNNSFNSTSQVSTQDLARIPGSDWTAYNEGQIPTWTTSTVASVFGSITLISGMTFSGSASAYTWEGRGSNTLNMAGKSFSKTLTFDMAGGTLTLQNDLTTSTTITHLSGTLTANNFNVNATTFTSSGTITRVLNMGNGQWTLSGIGSFWSVSGSGITLNCASSTIMSTDSTINQAGLFGGNGLTYNLVWLKRGNSTSTVSIGSSSGGTIYELRDTGYASHTLAFLANTTHNIGIFSVAGTLGAPINISSSATQNFTLSKVGNGIVNTKFLVISSSTANPANTWYAGTQSTNGANNNGWIFANPQPPSAIRSYVKVKNYVRFR